MQCQKQNIFDLVFFFRKFHYIYKFHEINCNFMKNTSYYIAQTLIKLKNANTYIHVLVHLLGIAVKKATPGCVLLS